MSILSAILVLIVFAVVFYLADKYSPTLLFRKIALAVIVVALIIWFVTALGLMGPVETIRLN